jgi:hypothetical protein
LVKVPEAGVPRAGVVSVGEVRVLFVSVCVPVKVATVESIAIVPLVVIVPPLRPVLAIIEVTVPLPWAVVHWTPVPVEVTTCPLLPTPLESVTVPWLISRPFLTLKDFEVATVHSPYGLFFIKQLLTKDLFS